jgi:hypothetical protein
LVGINNPDRLEEAYQFAFNIMEQIIKEQLELYSQQGKSFSYSGYFRKPKCRFEYNVRAGIIDDNSIFEKLKKV